MHARDVSYSVASPRQRIALKRLQELQAKWAKQTSEDPAMPSEWLQLTACFTCAHSSLPFTLRSESSAHTPPTNRVEQAGQAKEAECLKGR